MTSSSLPANPFVAAGMIEDLRLFVGRDDELRQIISRMEGVQPTSINIYGEKRIGKSSLLYHLFLTWEQRVQNPSRYVVIYLGLQNVQCLTENQFYQAIADELLKSATVVNNSALSQVLQVTPLDRGKFSDAVREWKRQGVLPVLCLDDFKTLFENKTEFNNGFYDNLRSLMDSSSLMLVIASQKKLDFYSKKHLLTSSFFNLGHLIKLGELRKDEVKELMEIPNKFYPNSLFTWQDSEEKLIKQLGENHPFLLQLAGGLIWEARKYGHDENWVKTKFDVEKKRLPKLRNFRFKGRYILGLIWNIFSRIGAFGLWLADVWNNSKDAVLGIVIVVVIVLSILGFFNRQQIIEFLQYLLNLVK